MRRNEKRTQRRSAGSSAVFAAVLLAAIAGSAGPALAAGDPVRIMPLGDSITESILPNCSYRYTLWNELRATGRWVDFVGSKSGVLGGEPPCGPFDTDHESYWGWRTDQILDSAALWSEAASPEILLIHLGHNDLWQGESVEGTVEELGRIVDTVRTVLPEAAFLIAQIIPARAGLIDSIPALNARIPLLAAEKDRPGSPVIAVDLHTGYDPVADNCWDGLHPDGPGDRKIGLGWFAALDGMLPVATGVDGPAGESSPGPKPVRIRHANPFSPGSSFSYSLPAAGPVRIDIYDIRGRRVRTLGEGYRSAGEWTASWDGRDDRGRAAGDGVYFLLLRAPVPSEPAKVLLVR